MIEKGERHMENNGYTIIIDDVFNIKIENGFNNNFMETALIDSSDRQEVENCIVRFYDKKIGRAHV